MIIRRYLWSASPAGRTKRSAIRNCLVWHSGKICRLGINGVTPPILNGIQADRAVLRVLQSKEDDEGAYCVTRVQTSGQNIYAQKNACQRPARKGRGSSS